HSPEAVLDNLHEAEHDRRLNVCGRYGLSNVNLDRRWVGRDMVGIDAGAAVLALDNFLMADRVRAVLHSLPCVRRAMERLGFTPRMVRRSARTIPSSPGQVQGFSGAADGKARQSPSRGQRDARATEDAVEPLLRPAAVSQPA